MSFTLPGELPRRTDPRRGATVLIAIKQRSHCKTRLAQALEPVRRLDLVRSMLTGVLAAAAAAQSVRQVIVISPERDCIPAVTPVLADTGNCLNSALTQAHLVLHDFDCREIVVLPADLPWVSAAEIDTLVRAGRSSGFAIAPDIAGTGTNALYLGSPQLFRFQFGPRSQNLHLEEGRRLGLSPQVVRLPGLEFDVDTPADLALLDRNRWHARLQA